MANPKRVKNRITAIGKIKKIANALEIVALTRLRRIEISTMAARGYFDRIRDVLFGMAGSINFKFHPFLRARSPVKCVGVIAIFSDKGLCGNFNANVAIKLFEFISKLAGKTVRTVIIGKKGAKYIKDASSASFIEDFLAGTIDEVFLLYSRFRLHLLGEVKIVKLLPVVPDEKAEREDRLARDYIYDPGAFSVFDKLAREYIANQIQHGKLESKCAEEMSRMLAMKSASENADEVLAKLELAYNKDRQASITRELTEIIAAAEAA